MSCLATKPVKPEEIYYGLHPEDKPDKAEQVQKEYEEFCKSQGL